MSNPCSSYRIKYLTIDQIKDRLHGEIWNIIQKYESQFEIVVSKVEFESQDCHITHNTYKRLGVKIKNK